MKTKVFLRQFKFPIATAAVAITLTTVVLSCSKEKSTQTEDKTSKVSPKTQKEMLNIVKVSDKSKESLRGLLGNKFFLSEGSDSPTESQVKVSVDVLDQVSKVSSEQTTASAINDPTAQSLACTETKFVGEGLSVFSAALKSSEASPEEKEAVPVLQEVAKDLIETSKQESCQNASFVPQPIKLNLPIEVPTSGLQLTDNSGQEISSGDPSEVAIPKKEEVAFDPSLSKPFQTALSEYVTALNADNAVKDFGFVTELKTALTVLSTENLKQADLEKVCGYVSALRIPIVASLNHPELGDKANALLTSTVCK